MHWSIREAMAEQDRDAVTHAQDDMPERHWFTTVSLTLPRLGEVDLRLNLAGSTVQACVVATQPGAMAQLRARGDGLTQRMQAQGLRLASLQVTQGARS
jgi:hypothetical protein